MQSKLQVKEYQLTRDRNKIYEYIDLIAYPLAATNDIDGEEHKSLNKQLRVRSKKNDREL